jgi:hypothetical protein
MSASAEVAAMIVFLKKSFCFLLDSERCVYKPKVVLAPASGI